MKIKTYKEIMTDMLARVPYTVNKEQGSVMWDALSPAAIELSELYLQLGDVFKLAFVRTSTGEYLPELCFQFGTYRLPATRAIRACQLNIEVPVGTRFSVENSALNFRYLGNNKLECEQMGAVGNAVQGRLLPIEFIDRLESGQIGAILVPGEDAEDDDSLRQRTILHITRPQQDGNVDQYIKWASEFKGIGNCTVLPLWDGPNTVKVVITDSEGNTASAELVASFQNFLDPGTTGKGEGVAPIGAFVTVDSATAQKIYLTITINLVSGFAPEDVYEAIHTLVGAYLQEATTEKMYKKYELLKRIDDLEGVNYVPEISGPSLISLDPTSIFTLGELEVMADE